ncbi:MAG: mechanosensitive ion channel, partial [Alphaproteobacteria bacterium]|nr:mechanosensitive ion channel [Alphaproteobacteria bacterium]
MLVQTIKSIRSFLSSGLGVLIFTCLVALSVVRLGLAEEPAQSEKAAGQVVKAEGLEPLIKTLENPEMREDLIKKIKVLQGLQEKKPETPKGFLDSVIFTITQQSMMVTEALVNMAPAVERIPAQFLIFFEKFSTHHLKGVLSAIILLGLAILIGFLFEKGCRILFTEIRKKSSPSSATSMVSQHAFLLTHLLAHIIPVFVFYIASVSFVYSVLIFFRQGSLAQMQAVTDGLGVAALHVLLSVFVYRACMVVANVILSPKASAERYLQINDQKANRMFNFLRAILVFAVVGFAISNITEVLGLEAEPRILWSRIVGLITTVMAINFVFQYRADVANWLRSEVEQNEARSKAMREILVFISEIWHLLATVSLLSIFVAWSINPETGHTYLVRCVTLSALTIMVVRIAHIVIVKLIRLLSGKSKVDIKPNQASSMPHLDALLHGIVHFGAFILLLNIWGVDLGELAKTKAGEVFIGHGLAIMVISLLAVLVWEIINRLIEDALRPMTIGGKLVQPSSRIKTFMPIVRNVFKWFIIILALVVSLAQLGINVTTLLAGLGVIGLAVAMGSQR